MADATIPVTRTLNKEFKGRCPRIQVSFAGSFMAVRIDDPSGVVTVKMAQEVMRRAGELMKDADLVTTTTPDSFSYHMDGVVSLQLAPSVTNLGRAQALPLRELTMQAHKTTANNAVSGTLIAVSGEWAKIVGVTHLNRYPVQLYQLECVLGPDRFTLVLDQNTQILVAP